MAKKSADSGSILSLFQYSVHKCNLKLINIHAAVHESNCNSFIFAYCGHAKKKPICATSQSGHLGFCMVAAAIHTAAAVAGVNGERQEKVWSKSCQLEPFPDITARLLKCVRRGNRESNSQLHFLDPSLQSSIRFFMSVGVSVAVIFN